MDSVLLLLNVHAISFPNDGCRMILITRSVVGCKQGGSAVCPPEIGFCLCCSSLFQQRLMTVWCAWSYREWIEAPRMAEAFRGGVEGPCRPSVWDSSEHVRNVFSSLVTKQWVLHSGMCTSSRRGGEPRGCPAAEGEHVCAVGLHCFKISDILFLWKSKTISLKVLYLTLKGLLVCTNCIPWTLIW